MLKSKQKELMEHIKMSNSGLRKESCLLIGLIIQSLKKYLFSAYYVIVMVLKAGYIVRRKTDTLCSMGTCIILWKKKVF
mgnify:CR=1 FL=1